MNGFFGGLSETQLVFVQYLFGLLSLIATAVVAIGLVFEYQGSKSDARNNWHPLTGGPPEYWDLERKGDWLIVIGVVFEFTFGFVAFASSGALDTQRQYEIATLRAETAEANLQLERLKTPRSLSPEQQQRMVMKLKPLRGQKFSLAYSGEPEQFDLLASIKSVLLASNWVEMPPRFSAITLGPDASMAFGIGVIVQIAPTADPVVRNTADKLATALNDEGIASKAEEDSRVGDPASLNVLVGSKPTQ
jgi:hypothetical protein